jgi:hypothetical protein
MKTAAFIEEQKAAKEKVEKPAQNSAQTAPKRRVIGRPFEKGDSRINRGGRPIPDWAQDIARAVFENNWEAIYKAMLKPLLNGNAYAFKELADRAYGKLKERHELTGPDGRPLQYQDVSDADLQKRVDDILRELGLVRAIDDAGKPLPGEGR